MKVSKIFLNLTTSFIIFNSVKGKKLEFEDHIDKIDSHMEKAKKATWLNCIGASYHYCRALHHRDEAAKKAIKSPYASVLGPQVQAIIEKWPDLKYRKSKNR